MRPGRWVQIVAVLIAGLCVVGSAFLIKPINDKRVDLQIVQQTRYGDAPKYALLAASMPVRTTATSPLHHAITAPVKTR